MKSHCGLDRHLDSRSGFHCGLFYGNGNVAFNFKYFRKNKIHLNELSLLSKALQKCFWVEQGKYSHHALINNFFDRTGSEEKLSENCQM